MKKQTKYISELGQSFDTPEEAMEDDRRIPHLISDYRIDVSNMEAELDKLSAKPCTPMVRTTWDHTIRKLKDRWRNKIWELEKKRRQAEAEALPEDRTPWPYDSEEPQWYRDQAIRWRRLSDAGWRFPTFFPEDSDKVSIRMCGVGNYEASFSVSKRQPGADIHKQLLGLCEMFHNSLMKFRNIQSREQKNED